MGSFEDQVAAFEKNARRKMDLAVRRISLDIYKRVILKSPVDTGRFRGNWQAAIGRAPSGTDDSDTWPQGDVVGGEGPIYFAKVAEADAKLFGAKAGDTIYLANNLPYAVRLEEGYSKTQAPQGMVALTVQEFAAIVDEIGIELSRQ